MASNVESARQAFLDALEEAGMDRATAEVQTRHIMPPSSTVVGNYADLQRMGAIQASGTIPTPPAIDDVDTGDMSEAFTMPPDPITREQVGNEGGAASLPAPAGVETSAGRGTPPDADDGESDLNSMTKAELEEEAGRRGVEVSSSMTKAEMVAAIEGG